MQPGKNNKELGSEWLLGIAKPWRETQVDILLSLARCKKS